MNYFLIACLFFFGFCSSSSASSDDVLKAVTSSFPNAIEIENIDGYSLEFCPDNTCEYYKAKKSVAYSTLTDAFYLYTYFFSDYFVLQEWRKKEAAKLVADNILGKDHYVWCKGRGIEKASCILREIGKDGCIEMFFVRYDENERNLIPIDLVKETEVKN